MSGAVDQHALIAALKDLAIELGQTPTKAEFFNRVRNARYHVEKHFGSYTTLVQAAGLEPKPESRVKISNDVFKRDIHQHLEKYEPVAVPPAAPWPTMAVISDIHWPFHCQRVIDKFYRYLQAHQPEHVVLNGDAWDMYSHAKFPRSHNQFTPREEQALARKLNEEFWREVQKAAPKAKCYQGLGNHDVRPMKRILEAYPAAEDWIADKLRDLFTFEGVETNHDPRQELFFGSIVVHHGFRSRLGDHRDYNLQNSISSHTHRPGVVYRTVRGQAIWELNTGYAGDPQAKGLSYTPTKTVDWVQSFGVVDEHGPRVIIG